MTQWMVAVDNYSLRVRGSRVSENSVSLHDAANGAKIFNGHARTSTVVGIGMNHDMNEMSHNSLSLSSSIPYLQPLSLNLPGDNTSYLTSKGAEKHVPACQWQSEQRRQPCSRGQQSRALITYLAIPVRKTVCTAIRRARLLRRGVGKL